MTLAFTVTQKQRLIELNAEERLYKQEFDSKEERDQSFKQLNGELVQKNKRRLERLRLEAFRPAVRRLEATLAGALREAGFVEVVTPTTLSGGMLEKMGITPQHPLWQQVFWLEGGGCLRPMLAPNLYYLLERLARIWPRPVKIFEIGQCFRKESKGSKHLSEFTMLNLVELGIPGDPAVRLAELVDLVMKAATVEYRLEAEESEVYGDTIDVMAGDLEVASGATGPHELDINWNIRDNWAGLGFGLERLVMVKEGFQNIRRTGRSLIYLDGARLNV